MNQSGGNVEQAALLDLSHVGATGAKLKPRSSPYHIPQDLAVTVVMPSRAGERLGAGPHQRRVSSLERDLSHDAGRSGGIATEPISRNCGNALDHRDPDTSV